MQDPIIWWTAFGALAQAAGALATFAAVAVSLHLARAERGLHGTGEVRIAMLFGEGAEDLPYCLSFELRNTGLRDLHWESVSWRVGWMEWGPENFAYRWAIQRDDKASLFVSQVVPPAQTGTHIIPLSLIKEALANDEDGFFRRKIWGLGQPPITAFARVAGRKPVRLKVESDVVAFLRTGEHPTHFERD